MSSHWLNTAGPHDFPPLIGVDNTQCLSAFFEDWTDALSEHQQGWDSEECMTNLLDSYGAIVCWLRDHIVLGPGAAGCAAFACPVAYQVLLLMLLLPSMSCSCCLCLALWPIECCSLGQIVIDLNTIVDGQCYFVETDSTDASAKIDIIAEAPKLAVRLSRLLGPSVRFNLDGDSSWFSP